MSEETKPMNESVAGQDGEPSSSCNALLSGVDLIVQERQRHQDEEGWTPEHDDDHALGELAEAAAVYALARQSNVLRVIDTPRTALAAKWPWDSHWFKPFAEPPASDPQYEHSFPVVDRIRCLMKAGALIAAEIDRLQRASAR
jgi:hypothetical protein